MKKWIVGWLVAFVLLSGTADAQQIVTSLKRVEAIGTVTVNGGTVALDIPNGTGYGVAALEAKGTWTGTAQLECAVSDATGGGAFTQIPLTTRAGVSANDFTANGNWTAAITGCQRLQVRATAAMTGTLTVTVTADPLAAGGGTGGAVTVTSGTITCTNCSGSGAATAEDTASADLMPMTPTGYVRRATPATTSSTDGDWEPVQGLAGRIYTSTTVDAALPAGTNNIGDVDVLSSALPTGAATSANQVTEQGYVDGLEALIGTSNTSLAIIDNIVFGAGTAATAQRVTFASDAPAVTITDGAGAVNVICDSGCSGGTTYTHDAALTVGTTVGVPAVGRASAAAPTDVTADNDAVLPWLLRNGAQATVLTAAGALIGGDATNGIDVDVTRSVLPTGASTAAHQVTEQGYVDGLEALIGTSNTSLAIIDNVVFGAGTEAAALRVTIATDSTGVLSVDDNGGSLTVDGTVTVNAGTGFAADKAEDTAHTTADPGPVVLLRRIDTLVSSADASGDYATFNSNASGALWTAPSAATNGGADSFKRSSVGTTEDEHEVKATAGNLYSITATNTNAAVRYLRCANNTAAGTTPGTTTPILDLAVPGSTTGAGITFPFPVGVSFSTGLTCWLVTGAADTDVAEVAANEIKVFYSFK